MRQRGNVGLVDAQLNQSVRHRHTPHRHTHTDTHRTYVDTGKLKDLSPTNTITARDEDRERKETKGYERDRGLKRLLVFNLPKCES